VISNPIDSLHGRDENSAFPVSARRSSRHRWALASALCLVSGAAFAGYSNADLPPAFQKAPFLSMSLSVGSPIEGFQLRAKRLRETESLALKNAERRTAYGHPSLVLMLQRSARQMAREASGAVLLVGDLSNENGGPLGGHRSHQSGRDADVGFFVTDEKGRPKQVDHFVTFGADGKAKDGSGLLFDDYRNWLLIQMWLKDSRAGIKYVFVAKPLRQRLLNFASSRPAFKKYAEAAAELLIQPSNSAAHDDHFHVRITCPKGQEKLCVERVAVSD
jgi:penicillin-insensitive murein endopeptidase